MQKLTRAWVKTHTRADGKKFYTAHVTKVSKIFWIFPVFWHMHIVQTWSPAPKRPKGIFGLYYADNLHDPYQFSTKMEAEEELMEQINTILDEINDAKNRKIVKVEEEDYVSLCPINNFN